MGYGEFGGGGSVHWQVLYSDPHDPTIPPTNPTGKARRGSGKDKGPLTGEGDKLIVTCTEAKLLSLDQGTIVVEVTLKKKKDTQVVLRWGDDIPTDLRNLSSAV